MIPMLTAASTVMCPHAGRAVLMTTNTEALIDGAPVLLQTDVHTIVGCTFLVAGVPTPCLTIRWVSGATQTKVHDTPVLLQTSVGLCLNGVQVPQGTAIVAQTQQAAKGV